MDRVDETAMGFVFEVAVFAFDERDVDALGRFDKPDLGFGRSFGDGFVGTIGRELPKIAGNEILFRRGLRRGFGFFGLARRVINAAYRGGGFAARE